MNHQAGIISIRCELVTCGYSFWSNAFSFDNCIAAFLCRIFWNTICSFFTVAASPCSQAISPPCKGLGFHLCKRAQPLPHRNHIFSLITKLWSNAVFPHEIIEGRTTYAQRLRGLDDVATGLAQGRFHEGAFQFVARFLEGGDDLG